jgi:hypothetical protein
MHDGRRKACGGGCSRRALQLFLFALVTGAAPAAAAGTLALQGVGAGRGCADWCWIGNAQYLIGHAVGFVFQGIVDRADGEFFMERDSRACAMR